MSTIHRRGVLLDGIGKELVRSANGGSRKTLSDWIGSLQNSIELEDLAETFTSGDATPDVSGSSKWITAGSTAITNFDGGTEGQVIHVYRGDSDIAITDNGNIDPIIAGNLTLSAARPSASFRLASGVWKQVAEAGALSAAMTPVVQAATLAEGAARLGSPFWFNITNPLYGASAAASDNYAAVNLAIAALSAAGGGTLYVPKGNFDIDLPAATGLSSLPAGARIKGDGVYSSTLTINCTTDAYLTAIAHSGNLIFEDITIQFNCQDGQTASLMVMASNHVFQRCRLLANCVDDSGPSNTAVLFNFPTSGTQTDLVVDQCEIAGWGYTFLKTNASTSTQRRTRLLHSYLHDNATCHFSPNSPSGVWDDVDVSGCTFGDEIASSAGTGHMIGLASVTNFRIVRNNFSGSTSGEVFHVEENTTDGVIAFNNIAVTSGDAGYGKGFVLLENDVGGVSYSPARILIAHNTIKRTGSTDGIGIHLLDTTALAPLNEITLTGNVISGFADGLSVDAGSTRVTGSGNVIKSCTDAVAGSGAGFGGSNFTETTIDTCTNGFNCAKGMAGRTHFRGTVSTFATGTAGCFTLMGWSYANDSQTLAAADTTNIVVAPVGARLIGRISASAEKSNANHVSCTRTLSYDGSTLTVVSDFDTVALEVKLASGVFDLTGFDVNSGNLRFRVYNAGAESTGVVVRADFAGTQIYS